MTDLRISKPGGMALFADDVAIYQQGTKRKLLMERFQKRIIPNVEKWYRDWRFNMNEHKTRAILNRKVKKRPEKVLKLYNGKNKLGQRYKVSWSDHRLKN